MARPGTIAHFVAWSSDLVLDTGDRWKLERWQRGIIADILAGKPTTWVVVPEGNGKTTLMAGLALYQLDPEGWGIESPMIVVAAATREQAEWLYLQAENFVRSTPGMVDRMKCLGGFRRINRKDGFGRIQVFAADDRTADGAIFTLAVIDELHNHRDLRLYRRWRGKLQKRGGQIVAISTAGEPGSDFEDTRARILKSATKTRQQGANIRAEAKDVVIHDWAVRDRELVNNMTAVKRANPRKAITLKSLRAKRDDPTMTPEHWLRFTCNIASRMEGQGINPEDWDALADSDLHPEPGLWCVGGIDIAWAQDHTGIAVVGWESSERRLVLETVAIPPPVDQHDVVSAVLDLHERWGPIGWAYDPNASAEVMAQLLRDGEHPEQVARGIGKIEFFEHGQNNAAMSLAAARLDEAVRNRWLLHDGNEELRRHVLNAIRKPLPGEKFRFDRPPEARGDRRRNYPIDLLTAILMAHSVAASEHDKPATVPLVAVA